MVIVDSLLGFHEAFIQTERCCLDSKLSLTLEPTVFILDP